MITSQNSLVVVATTLFHVQAGRALDFAVYLEEQKLSESLCGVLDCALLKNVSSDGVFLDLELLQTAPEAVLWLQERHCHRLPGCRVTHYQSEIVDTLAASGYQVERWASYSLVAASAIEVSIVAELCGCSCLLQLELPGASYLEIPVH